MRPAIVRSFVARMLGLLSLVSATACGDPPRAEAPSPPLALDVSLIAGPHTTCLREGNALECWGQNHTAQLGEVGAPCGDSRCLDRPRFMAELGAVADLVIGDFHACALDPAGGVSCLGGDHYGQIGGVARAVCTVGGYVVPQAFLNPETGEITHEGTQEVAQSALPCATAPTPIAGLDGVTAIFGGSVSTCARRGDALLCAGRPVEPLGLDPAPDRCPYGSCSRRFAPVPLGAMEDVQFGTYGACWRTTGGEARCDGGLLDDLRARAVSAIAVGHQHVCFLHRDGTVECGGWNAEGSIGNGETTPPESPAVPLTRVLNGARQIVAGSSHTCAVLRDGTLHCWGTNDEGQLGVGDTQPRLRPTRVEGLTGVVDVALGTHHTCAVTQDGVIRCWGSHRYGELGIGPDAPDICTSGILSAPRIPCAMRPVVVPRAG